MANLADAETKSIAESSGTADDDDALDPRVQ
ncbi:unnamed protein product, partial [Adineta steineri]